MHRETSPIGKMPQKTAAPMAYRFSISEVD
jgi:hypothetical protein